MIKKLKLFFSVAAWVLALPAVLLETHISGQLHVVIEDAALLSFSALLLSAMLGLRAQYLLVTMGLFFIGALLLPNRPALGELREAGSFVLIFACLMPTLALVRATAMTMPSVSSTQAALGKLPAKHTASGLQLASQILGSVMNIGSFALVAASLPLRANETRRLIAASAALRGMNSAVLWSPFFISFAVGVAYLEPDYALGAIGLGLITSLFFFMISASLSAPKSIRFSFFESLKPLRPVWRRVLVGIGSVIAVSAITGLTALYAVVVTMPILCLVQMFRRPETAKEIFYNFGQLQQQTGGDLVIISVSMIVSVLAQDSYVLAEITKFVFEGTLEIWQIIWIIPALVWFCSIFGIHPVISSAPLLALFSSHLTAFESMFVMQAHMIGWSTGTMSSISSMSVITVAEQFRLRPAQLAFGPNMIASGGLAIFGGGFWALIFFLLN